MEKCVERCGDGMNEEGVEGIICWSVGEGGGEM